MAWVFGAEVLWGGKPEEDAIPIAYFGYGHYAFNYQLKQFYAEALLF